MADSSALTACALCGGPLDVHDLDRGTCHDCRSPKGKIADLDIAIRASGDDPKRISDWPVIRHLLRKRFGQDRSDAELWERCTDWLRAEGRLPANDYLPLPLTYLHWLLEHDFSPFDQQAGNEKLEALQTFHRELESWNCSNSPSETGYVVEDVQIGHPLHAAVVALQPFYGGALPKPALGHWRTFLKLARSDDEAAEDRAELLLEWVNGEIEPKRAGALPEALEVTSNGQIRLTDWAVATHGVLLDHINLGPRPKFGNKFPISVFDAVVVDGDTPTVCPKTDRPIPAEWLPTIEEVFKRVGLVKPGQTIHWVGGQAKLENICTCFREGFPKPAATLTANAANGGDLIERLLAGPDDAELSPRELAMLEAHLARPVSMAAIQREKQATGESETNAKRNKLKLIRDFNRNLQAAIFDADPAADAEVSRPTVAGSATMPAKTTERGDDGAEAESDDALPKSKRADSPSRIKAKSAYDYAMERIPDAHAMTAPELFDAIMEDGEAAAMLPPKAESFTKYLNDCGIRLKKGGPRAAGGSVVRRSDL